MSIGFQLYNLFGRADILSFGYSGCKPNDNIFPCTFTPYHIKKENSICAEPGECIFSLCMILIIRPTLQPKGEGCLTTHQSHCNRLVFCKPIELHRYKAIHLYHYPHLQFCKPIELHRYKANLMHTNQRKFI